MNAGALALPTPGAAALPFLGGNHLAAPVPSKARDVEAMARYRVRRGLAIAERLETLARAHGSAAALREADLIRACADPSNVWVGRDLHRDDGELFDGVGTFAACGSRLCPSCSARLRVRSRRSARAGVERVRLLLGEHWRFLTLTAPTVHGVSAVDGARVFQRAWSLLRKRQWWRETVRAGVKGIEWSQGESGDGYHVHMHLLVASRYVDRVSLRDEWTLCIEKAWLERGVELVFNTHTNAAVVDVRLVRGRGGKSSSAGASVSLEDAIQEVCKYVTKPGTWDSMSDVHLVEAATVERWGRLFEVFGACRESHPDAAAAVTPKPTHEQSEVAALEPYVHTQSLSDGASTLMERAVAYERRRERRERVRAPSLRALAGVIGRDEWLKVVAVTFAAARAYRRAQLAARYPYATFVSLRRGGSNDGRGIVTPPAYGKVA